MYLLNTYFQINLTIEMWCGYPKPQPIQSVSWSNIRSNIDNFKCILHYISWEVTAWIQFCDCDCIECIAKLFIFCGTDWRDPINLETIPHFGLKNFQIYYWYYVIWTFKSLTTNINYLFMINSVSVLGRSCDDNIAIPLV